MCTIDFYPENVLLTGSTGFIGSYVNQLLDYRCAIANRHLEQNSKNSKQLILAELVGSKSSSLLSGVKVIIHLANLAHSVTYEPLELQSVNVNMTLALARNAAKYNVKRFVYVSSIVVNGTNDFDSPFCSTSKVSPNNDYARSKHNAEIGLMRIAEETGLEVVIIRPTLVYGPNAPANIGSLTKVVKRVPILPFGLIDNRRDFISVLNLADLLVTCCSHPNAVGKIFLASDGKSISIKHFTLAIAKGLGKSIIQLPIPESIMRFGARLVGKSLMAEQLLGNLEVNSSELKQTLDWSPPYSMDEAMSFFYKDTK